MILYGTITVTATGRIVICRCGKAHTNPVAVYAAKDGQLEVSGCCL